MRLRLRLALSSVSSRRGRLLISLTAVVAAFALMAGASLLLHNAILSTIAGQIIGAIAGTFAATYTAGWAFENRRLKGWWI